MRGKHAKQKDLLACSTVMTQGGQSYTVAKLGGGSQLDIESSAYANCDIGIYISATDGPASLNQTVVNGVFEIGIYVDGVGAKINQTSICVNGTDQNGNCEPGSGASGGTGIDAQNTPNLSLNHTNIDGYAAGFATSPCPNDGNELSVNQSTVTNSTYPWSFQGGQIKTNHDSPTPPDGGSCAGTGVGAGPQPGAITEYAVSGNPTGITAGPDGALWYGELGTSDVGRITTAGIISNYQTPTTTGAFGYSGPLGITTGPDGALWFTEHYTNPGNIGRVTTSGVMTEYSVHSGGYSAPTDIVTGPDGNLWFTEEELFGGAGYVGKITPAGVITEYAANASPYGIAKGSDGALWFAEAGASNVGRITTAGVMTEYPVPSGGKPIWIAPGPDGALWFTDSTNNIGRITTSGAITEYSIPTSNSNPFGIAPGPDGALWFVEYTGNNVGRITTSGVITEYPIPTGASAPFGITAGPDGNMWFTEAAGNKIGSITTGESPNFRRGGKIHKAIKRPLGL